MGAIVDLSTTQDVARVPYSVRVRFPAPTHPTAPIPQLWLYWSMYRVRDFALPPRFPQRHIAYCSTSTLPVSGDHPDDTDAHAHREPRAPRPQCLLDPGYRSTSNRHGIASPGPPPPLTPVRVSSHLNSALYVHAPSESLDWRVLDGTEVVTSFVHQSSLRDGRGYVLSDSAVGAGAIKRPGVGDQFDSQWWCVLVLWYSSRRPNTSSESGPQLKRDGNSVSIGEIACMAHDEQPPSRRHLKYGLSIDMLLALSEASAYAGGPHSATPQMVVNALVKYSPVVEEYRR
ncbi:hypothetical protein B0H11DRAFT_2225712 [Mycena galericulata]|nr:hypothetical protein B0H11DRAFT_2225712 [Mycena galericulata]